MRLVSFETGSGSDWGIVREDGIVSGRRWYPSLKAALAANEVAELGQAAKSVAPDRTLDAVRLLPPIPDPEHIYCAGLNYAAHAQEVGKAAPEVPRIFLRTASSLIGHGAAVERPRVSTDLDYEGELAVVIGKGGRHIAAEDAMAHVAGFTRFMDGSIRDYQKNTTTAGKISTPPERWGRFW